MQTRRCRNRTTFVNESSLATAVGDLGTMPLLAHRLQQLRHWKGLVLDRNERLAICDTVDGQDEDELREAALRMISDPRQSDGRVLDALGNLERAIRGTK